MACVTTLRSAFVVGLIAILNCLGSPIPGFADILRSGNDLGIIVKHEEVIPFTSSFSTPDTDFIFNRNTPLKGLEEEHLYNRPQGGCNPRPLNNFRGYWGFWTKPLFPQYRNTEASSQIIQFNPYAELFDTNRFISERNPQFEFLRRPSLSQYRNFEAPSPIIRFNPDAEIFDVTNFRPGNNLRNGLLFDPSLLQNWNMDTLSTTTGYNHNAEIYGEGKNLRIGSYPTVNGLAIPLLAPLVSRPNIKFNLENIINGGLGTDIWGSRRYWRTLPEDYKPRGFIRPVPELRVGSDVNNLNIPEYNPLFVRRIPLNTGTENSLFSPKDENANNVWVFGKLFRSLLKEIMNKESKKSNLEVIKPDNGEKTKDKISGSRKKRHAFYGMMMPGMGGYGGYGNSVYANAGVSSYGMGGYGGMMPFMGFGR